MTRLAVVLAVSLFCFGSQAAEPDAAKLFAWYRTDGIKLNGARVTAWENSATSGAARSLTRIAGKPAPWLVTTPAGPRPVLRLDGSSALWQPANAWGAITGERTIVAFVRLAPKAEGCLFDGSTRSGVSPAQFVGAKWQTAAVAAPPPKTGEWSVQSFVFRNDAAPLGGFILGANVATQAGLECDVAEVLVFDRTLGAPELQSTADYLREKWARPTDLPAAQQPKAPTIPDDPRVFRTIVRKRGDDGVHTYRIPGLATTTKGTLVAVFDIRRKHAGDLPADIDVGAMRSADNGATWSPMTRVIDFDAAEPESRGNGVGDPAILVDEKTGHLFVAALWSNGDRAWNGSGPGLTPRETGQFVIARSTDDGVTWSRPQNITAQVKQPDWRLCFNGPGRGIQQRDGTLVFPAQFRDARGAPHSCFIASRDHGETWKISPPAIPGTPPTSESAIVELADGSLLLSMRNESRAGQRAWARWRDDQWSAPWFAAADPTCMASLLRHPRGDLLLANPNDSQRRIHLTIRSSKDEGRTWSAGRLLDPRPSAYSAMTVLKDGNIGILYETGDTDAAETLTFARFPLEWAREGATAADEPEGRLETTGKFASWPARHAEKVALSKHGGIDLAFLGDSITQGWETTGTEVWQKHFAQRNAANYGFGGDSTQHVLWRIDHGEFDGISPRAIVLMIGTNNARHGDFTPAQIAGGIRAILDRLAAKCPKSQVLLLAIFPRGATAADPLRVKCEAVNAQLPALADGKRVHFLNLNRAFLQPDGTLTTGISPDLLHLSAKGYILWAEAMDEKLRELLGD